MYPFSGMLWELDSWSIIPWPVISSLLSLVFLVVSSIGLALLAPQVLSTMVLGNLMQYWRLHRHTLSAPIE
jgi:hypothetical protein